MDKLKLFNWQGINRFQQKQRGSIIALNPQAAQQMLLARGLQRIKLQRNWQLPRRPKETELCDLLVQLATLLQSAVPLKNSLQILQQNCVNIALYAWLSRLLVDLETGLSFSQAIQKQQMHSQVAYLTAQELQLIRVGEMTGNLAQVCQQIASYRQQALALQRKVQKILLYPAIVLSVSLILTWLLLLFVVPQFAAMYGNNELPTFTAVLLTLSTALQQYWLHMLSLFALFGWLLRSRLKNSAAWRAKKIVFMQKIPLLRGIIQLNRLISFCRNLQLMLQAGIPLNQGLNSFLPQQLSWQKQHIESADVVLTTEVRRILNCLGQGYPLYQSVSEPFFPEQAQQMLEVGEKSGKLGLMLQHIADNYQQRLDHQVDLLSQMLEPILMLIIGSLIGLIMLGMYLPIFNMGSLIQ
ncbi:type II secretion system F family protein [[Haemophilus] felis]|nr:type II secretion system F family protein [[Haemophilus] felis]NBI42346.1 type II secretion system F family protein [[Haemophilus] felis]